MARRRFTIIFTVIGVAVVVSMTALFAIYLLFGRVPPVPRNAMLTFHVGGDLAEVAPADIVGYVSGGARTPTVRALVDNLRKAKADPRITAVLLKPSGFTTPFWGKIQELRDAVLDFKKSGKPVYAFLEYGGDRDYYLATAADKVFLMPSSSLELTGVATYALFLRGTLDKVGAYADLHHIGDYKTAPNTFTEPGYTDAHREMDLSLNRDLFGQIVQAIAEGRNQSVAQVRAVLDEGPFLPEQAVRAGLVDELAYEDQVKAKLRAAAGQSATGPEIDTSQYARVSARSLGLDRGPRVAVIYAAGAIVGGRSGSDPLSGAAVGSETLIRYIRDVRRDDSIRAIVLRIDSPGGSAGASDAIWRELMLAREERADRPIVASMSDLAASGGYYLAMAAHAIVAQPSTLTGSIGIFGGKLVTGGVYEKLGANLESVGTGRRAEMHSPARRYTPDEVQKIQEQLQAFYDQFIAKAADARGTTPEQIDRLAQGRVWTGRQAKENGLVDALGGLEAAIAVAKERANIPADSGVELVTYPPRKSFLEVLSEELAGGGQQAAIGAWVAANVSSAELDALRALRGPLAWFRRGEPLALMPFTVLR
jgi:protease-4